MSNERSVQPRAGRPIDAPPIPSRVAASAPVGIDEPTFDVLADDLPEPAHPEPSPVVPAPPAPSPAELARRLAEQAKQNLATARTEKQEDRMAQEDPRELARRLAEQAKNRMKASAAPEPVHVADEPAPADDDDGPAIAMAPTRPAAERAATSRPMTALEALAAAREAEKARAAEARAADAREARVAEARAPQADRGANAAPERAAPRPVSAPIAPERAATVVGELFPNAIVDVPTPIGSADVFRALWRAHRARAVHDGDASLAVTASVLLDAAGRVSPPNLVACRVTLGDRRFAAWVDLERGVVLGMAAPVDVFLAG